MKKFFSYIKLLHEYNTLANKYDMVSNNFKNSAYKHILDFESQDRTIQMLREQNLHFVEKIRELKKQLKKERKKNV